MNIPAKVKEAAQELIAIYGSHLKHLGKSDGADFYMFKFPDDEDTGFPVVYQFENNEVLTLTGFAALNIARLFVK